jgi:hypothetical protein
MEEQMGHRIVNAIIEDGQLKYVGEKLPAGRLEVHLVYDTIQEHIAKRKAKDIVKRSAGIYRGMDAAAESRRLRRSWERGPWK